MKTGLKNDQVVTEEKGGNSYPPYQQILFPYDPIEYWQRMRDLIKQEIAKKESFIPPLGTTETKGLTYKPVYRIDEVCALFSVTRQTIYDWVKHGLLKPRKVRSRVYFLSEDVMSLMEDKSGKI